jgi:hypothetical protein
VSLDGTRKILESPGSGVDKGLWHSKMKRVNVDGFQVSKVISKFPSKVRN